MKRVNDERWGNLLLSFGIDPKYLQELKARADGKFGTATQQLTDIKKFSDENGVDINVVVLQVLIRDVYADLAMAAERWDKVLEMLHKKLPCQQAQYARMDVVAIRQHCDSFIKYGPKPPDEEIPLEASEYKEEEQMSEEGYLQHLEQERLDKEAMLSSKPQTPPNDAEPEAN